MGALQSGLISGSVIIVRQLTAAERTNVTHVDQELQALRREHLNHA